MKESEIKSLAGSAKAQKKTGAPVEVHIFPWPVPGAGELFGNKALDILESNGADLSKICVNHVDVSRKINVEYIISLLKRGVYVSFDNFGHEFALPRDSRSFAPGAFATDWERCECIHDLIGMGYGKKILIANDICHKQLLIKYGGCGYANFLETAPDMLLDLGSEMRDINDLLINNPAEFFAF
jgi:phosphotriesterase-related protein